MLKEAEVFVPRPIRKVSELRVDPANASFIPNPAVAAEQARTPALAAEPEAGESMDVISLVSSDEGTARKEGGHKRRGSRLSRRNGSKRNRIS